MGSQPLKPPCAPGSERAADREAAPSPADYCREVEAYLCRKNDGHLIRIVGPSFDLVSRWASQGVPLTIAFRGVDRYFERYYRKGARRRPVRIDFCEADVLDLFDEWRRALGLTSAADAPSDAAAEVEQDRGRGTSMPAHLERLVLRLTRARVSGALGPDADELVDSVARELDAARAARGGLRGEAREALIGRLAVLDRELIRTARRAIPEAEQHTLGAQADVELAPFRATMAPDRYAAAHEAAVDRLVRARFDLPILTVA